ncbi:alpha-(1,3)-fucosyltransferase C-like [Aethina tumida]|uniref:alpha-(1,3)-fucosyltransferase C-like n=1 Tax=Aethina tumida TaxID=116153 RepID=UPI002148B4EB|nr:alpha-(1,3)-fucosyltransferase C-like [Aethina tumida]
MPLLSEIEEKQKKVAWFVSNCNDAPSKRLKLVREMQQYIDIDIYGKCGTLSCSKRNQERCYKDIERQYKFYLSFENSLCQDYVTEKLFYLLNYNIVPVVYGGVDYNVMAPPHSVINVMDFETVPDLVNYLKYLDNNVTEYMKYFEWKKHYTVKSPKKVMCDLCAKLNQPIKTKVYNNIQEWWRGQHGEICQKVPEIVTSISKKKTKNK